ncbi:tRNA delta(2)-isopentenylpyrophosphate transferase [Intrasporangium chromatireducens Q5-1]|uniref:tRNA dimethylallyltransferase n=1 Tax=Intrasporangium chromatireducens Q5-1 TaxID=584657 RepID=W9GNM1_9MICO|nr:tRNA delta(2)-isopentenylpyrophosphate transferase [Intrasporangium chromatireducens Q5-1]
MTIPVVAIVGATATGKSDLGLALAERLDGEVVNADAMQLYRGMDVGTAKLPVPERRGIPHHQLDVLDVTEEASVAAYQGAARADIDAIRARGRAPILVGGSGLYVRAALDRLDIPPTDAALRAALEREAASHGTAPLFDRLRGLDPQAADRIQPNNTRRIVRALEVIELTGRPFSASLPKREFASPAVLLGLSVDRAVLDERIAARAARMFTGGLLDEVRELLGHGLRDGFTASRAIGYAQAIAVLDGQSTVEEAVASTTRATRRFARRQESWFRPDPRTTWLPADRLGPDALVAAALAALASATTRGTAPDSAKPGERHTREWTP